MELAPNFFDIMELAKSPVRTPVRATKPVKKEEPKDETPEKIDLGFPIDPAKTYTFETLKKSEVPRFENLGAFCKAYDPFEKRYRDMRYLATAPSIFPEEWDESFLERPEPPLGFWRNQITALGEDIRLMEYLMNNPLYDNSPFRVMNRPAMYTLADKDVQEAIKAKRHETEKKALDAIESTPIDDLKPIARMIFNITETSDTAIINAMNDFVKKPKVGMEKQSNAEKVLENLTNPKLNRKYIIQNAIDNGIISIDRTKMEARMTEGNVIICHLQNKDSVEELTNYTFSENGKKWYSMLRSKI